MADTNGSEAQAALERLKKRVDSHDEEFVNLRFIVKALSDAMVVQAHLERKQSDAISDGQSHEARIDDRIEKLIEAGAQMDARLDKLVVSIGELIRRMPPQPAP